MSKFFNEYLNAYLKEALPLNASEEEVSELREIIIREFNLRVNTFVFTSLPNEDVKNFIQILQSGNHFVVHSFLVQKIPDFTTKLNENIKDFYLSVLNIKNI